MSEPYRSGDEAGPSRALIPRGPVWTPQPGPNPQAVHSNPSSSVSVHFIWRSVVRWWKLALPLGLLLAAGLGSALWMNLKPQYRAEAWLRIEDHRPYIAFPGVDASGAFARNQIEMIRSPVVLGEILSQRDIAQLPDIKAQAAPVEWLQARVGVASLNNSEFFKISFEGPDPAAAAAVVNAVMTTYIEFQQKQAESQNSRIIDLLERTRETRVRELERLQENVRTKTIQATGHDPGFVAPNKQVYISQDSRVRALEDKLTTIAVDRELAGAKLKTLQDDFASQPIKVPESMIEEKIASDERLKELDDALEAQHAVLKLNEKAGRSEIPVVRAKIDDLTKKISDLQQRRDKLEQDRRAKLKEELERKLNADRQSAIAQLQGAIQDHNLLEKTYQKELEEARKHLEHFGQQAFDLEIARGEMAHAEGVRDKIAERITVLRTEQSAPTQVSRFRDAVVPVQPYTTPLKKVVAATAGGFVFPFVLAVLWELRVRRISSVEQFTTEISLPVVGEITTLPVRSVLPGRRSADRFERHRSTFEESIAYVRTSLLLSDELRDLQVLAVASAISREGKSSLASQLAVSLANATGETTLLIDTDMRDPDIHDMFGIDLSPGLADILEHKATLDEAVVTSFSRTVHILPAGRLMRSPHVLLGGGGFHALLDEARARYRYVVIDSPPVLAASESLVVAKAADGTLLCTMRDISRVSQVRQANERLRAAGARPLGAVFSGVPPQNYAYKYGGYYDNPYSRRTWTKNAQTMDEPPEATHEDEPT